MRDLDLRALERDPDPLARVDLLEARLRSGQVTLEGLQAAAILGEPAAAELAKRQGWPSRYWDHALATGPLAEPMRALLCTRPTVLPRRAYLQHHHLGSRDVESCAFLSWGPREDFVDALHFWGGCLLLGVEAHGSWSSFLAGLSGTQTSAQEGPERLRTLLASAVLPPEFPDLGPEPAIELLAPLSAWNDRAWVLQVGSRLVGYHWWTTA